MAVFKTLFRDQEAISYVPNSSGTAKLQRNYNYSFIWFELVVNYTLQASATFKYLNFANLIRSFQITGNGSTEFKNQSFNQLVYQTYFYCQGKMVNEVPVIDFNSATGANNTYTHVTRVLVPLASLTMSVPSDTGLISSNFQTLDYVINWTDTSAVGTNLVINSAQLKPVSFEKIETILPNETTSLNLKLIQKLQSEQITTSTNGYLINVPPNKQYNSFQFDLINGTTGAACPNVVKAVKFLNGTDVITQVNVGSLKAENQRRYDLNDELFKKVYATEITKNQVINPDAHFILNFSDRGHYSNSKALTAFNMPQISIDTQLPADVTSLALNISCNYAE